MKKLVILGTILISMATVSCSDLKFGDSFIDNKPENAGATLDSMFNSRINAEKVLTKAYTYLPYGLPTGGGGLYNKMGTNIPEAITDLYQSFRDNIGDGPMKLYYNGALSANNTSPNQAYQFANEVDWYAIRYGWIYLENVNRVPDMSEADKNERIAEAKMIIALSYSDMLRNIGGVPWLDHSIEPNETMKFPRITFEQTVTKIVTLLDEAIPYLKWKHSDVDDGRMSKAGAMGLKLRVLLFAASPTFNSNTLWHPNADEYTCYTNENQDRWKKAMQAGEAFMSELSKQAAYELIQPTANTHEARRKAYQKAYYDRGGTEVLISTRRSYNSGVLDDFYSQRYYSGPTLNYVNMFPWADGSDFPENFNWEHPSKQPFFEADGTPTRDPRLYETAAVPGDKYFNGVPAAVYTNHPDYKNGSGFLMMKFILREDNDRSERPIQWPYLRLPEVLLSYAEAINEFNGSPNAVAYKCINDIRARVGLPALPGNLKKEAFREALLRERALELGFEEVRWYDLVRWGRADDFKKKLYGLKTLGDNANAPTKFTFKKVELNERYWAKDWNTKWYLSPIPQNEVNKKYGMTQNPGW